MSHARLSGSVFNAEDASREPGPVHPLQGSLIAPETFLVQNRQVSIGGVLLEELKAAYGTPLYILDATTIRSACRAYKQTLQTEYGENHLLVYACKANLTLGLCKLLESEGFGLDVVSAGELYTAIKAKFPAERIVMNGNNKSPQEVALALDYGINRLIIDNASELPVIAGQAKRLGTVANVLIRVSPGIECHTHEYIRTGQADSKFGVPLSQLASLIETIQKDYAGTIALKGLQAHIGSQIFELKAYQDLVKIMLNVVYNIRQEYDLELEDLDIGGGLGIAYTEADDPQPIATLVRQSATLLATYADKLQLKRPRLLMEPGRSLIARAGCTLYTVGTRKDIEGYPSFVAVDGGMGDNIRPALYQAEYTAIAASKVFEPATETVKLVGKYCESGDILLREFQTPQLQPGDLVLLFGTGAYNYTMASHYNRFPKPAMVLVEDGRSALLSKRDTLDDLIANDLIPEWLLTN